jgi:PAS domain S-box-containing protein
MLRRRLILPAAAIALVLILVLTGLGIWAGRVIVSITTNHLIQQMSETVRRDVGDMTQSGDRALSRMINDLAWHEIPLGDPAAVGRELYGLLRDERYVQWLAFGNEVGGVIDAGRLGDGTLVFLMTDGFRAGVFREFEALPDGRMGKLRKSGVYLDAREKLWYTRARDTGKRYWSEPFLGSGEPVLGLALSAPVYNKDGSFAGVCDINLILTALSNFMQSLRLGDHGRAFIVDTAGQLIAASGGMSPVVTGADGTEQRLHASEVGDPIIRDTARYLGLHPEIGSASTDPRLVSFDDPTRGTIYAAIDRFEAPGGLAWIIVSALPASDFLGPVYHAAYLSLAIAVIIVAVFLALGLWSAGRALRPLAALTKAAQAAARGEWGEVPETRRKDEVGLLARAFNLMTARLGETLDGLRQSEARFEEAQRMAHVGYWHRDLDTNRITWSDETYRIFGLKPREPEITPPRLQELIHPEDRGFWNEAVTAMLEDDAPYDVEYRVVRPDGELRIVHSKGGVTRDEAGRRRRIFGTIQDITERKRAEDGLRDAQTELAHVNRVATMGQLSASIAHEVNQPVAAVLINAGAALRWLSTQTPDLKEARESLGRIVKDAKRAGEIIDRIRALIKKAAPQKDRLDVNEAALEVVALARSELLRDRVSLQTQFADDLPLVQGDRIQLQQVLLNLIINAVEAMRGISESARELWISTEKDATGGVRVAVRDTGPGVDPQSGGRLFEAFYTTKPSGMGMGLSICRAIIEAHGGRIWATANEPRGAVFQFTLPTRPETNQTQSN